MISVQNIYKQFGGVHAVDGISLEIQTGLITGLIGPNGAGKSTLFKCLLGLITTTSGEGSVLGLDIRTQGEQIRSKIGYMPEYNALDPNLFAVDQVRYAGELLGMNSKNATQRAHEVLEYVGLKDQRYRKIETFSTGMLQATKLACALVHDPDILICDEPTNGLDQRARSFMLQTLNRTVKEGNRSVLMSSHVMDDVEDLCDSIVMIHKGKIVVQSNIDDLVEQVDKEVEMVIWGGASKMESELSSMGLENRRLGRVIRIKVEDDSTVEKALQAAVSAGVQVRQMKEYEPDLEDIFLLVMDKLGAQIKGTEDLMTSEHTGGD